MAYCVPCKDKSGSAGGGGGEGSTALTDSGSGICVRCITFWLLVILLTAGLIFHEHKNGHVTI